MAVICFVIVRTRKGREGLPRIKIGEKKKKELKKSLSN